MFHLLCHTEQQLYWSDAVFYIEPVRRPQADNFQPGLATLLLAGPTGWQLFV